MNRPLPIKLTALALSLCLLGSTFNLVLSTHFCGGSLKTWSLIGEAEKCSPQEMEQGCSVAIEDEFTGRQVNKKPCCQDIRFVLGSATDHEEPTTFLAAHRSDFVGTPTVKVPSLVTLVFNEIATSRIYKPPLVVHIIYLLYEVFRI